MKNKEWNNILDECLERILSQGEDLETCLRDYPEQAAKLRPFLETVLTARKVTNIQPRPEFMARARYQFRLALQEAKPSKARRFFIWQPVWGTVIAVVLVLVLGSSVTVVAAGNSMPDEALYPVKIATEQVRLRLTPSPLARAELNAELADKRVAEIVYLANKSKPGEIELVSERLNRNLERIAELSQGRRQITAPAVAPAPSPPPAPAFKATPEAPAPPKVALEPESRPAARKPVSEQEKLKLALARYAAKHPQQLREALKNARDESVKRVLDRAIKESEKRYLKARQSLED